MFGLRNIYNWATLRPHYVILWYEPCVIGFYPIYRLACVFFLFAHTVLLHHHFYDTMWMPLTWPSVRTWPLLAIPMATYNNVAMIGYVSVRVNLNGQEPKAQVVNEAFNLTKIDVGLRWPWDMIIAFPRRCMLMVINKLAIEVFSCSLVVVWFRYLLRRKSNFAACPIKA